MAQTCLARLCIAAMELQRLARIVQQQQQRQQRPQGHVALPNAGHRRLRRAEGAERRTSAVETSFRLQAQAANRSGRGRTEDFIMPVSSRASRSEVKGRGAWKKWTPDAILRAGFSPGSMSARDAASQVDGASAASTLAARLFVAECIEEGQTQHNSQSLHRLQHLCKDDPLDFAFINLMFDETELELNMGVHGEAAWSVLASHGQITYCGRGEVIDMDGVRAPCILPTKKAVTMWPVLSAGPCGLWPGVTSLNAKFRAVLVTCDAGPANLKLLKHLCTLLPPGIGVICTLCAQHRNGNVIERATKLLGILPGCFAIAKSMRQGSWMRTIGQKVQAVLASKLVILQEEPEGLEEEWARARVGVRALLKLVALNLPQGEDEQPARGFATTVDEFMKFFPSPWKGPGFCSCHVLRMLELRCPFVLVGR